MTFINCNHKISKKYCQMEYIYCNESMKKDKKTTIGKYIRSTSHILPNWQDIHPHFGYKQVVRNFTSYFQ